MASLVAGPWCGEFGWELCVWNPVVRKYSEGYDEVIVYGKPGMEYLYKDFAEYREYDIPHGSTDGCFVNGKIYKLPDNIVKQYGRYIMPSNRYVFYSKVYKSFKIDVEKKQRIIIHARNTNKMGTGIRNWPIEKWRELVARLSNFEIISIGTKSDALYIENSVDKRSIGLENLILLINSSLCVVGPSSGPMHLASLCETPHVVWTDSKVYDYVGFNNKYRYEKAWNPFNTPVKVIEEDRWNPDVDKVYKNIMEIVK